MVTSSAYRQSSAPNARGMASDADNRLLWRKSPVRLDAESLRDSMLVVSGKLNRQMGGPGFHDVSITPNNGTTYYEPIYPQGAEFNRRTVYRFSPRGGRSAILDTFDMLSPRYDRPQSIPAVRTMFDSHGATVTFAGERKTGPDSRAAVVTAIRD